MRSIKPGRGPSAAGAVGGIVAVVFGIFWTIMTFSMTRDSPFPVVGTIFPLFGILFIAVGIGKIFYNAHNATSRNRFSEFDITSPHEESDPLDDLIVGNRSGGPLDSGDSTISERLAKVEELREKKLISEEEYFEQRDRILSEI